MFRLLSSCALSAAVFLAATPAVAQSGRPERPYRGLFASGTADATQVLSVSASAAAGYDTDVLADARGGNVTGAQSAEGVLGNFAGGLAYWLQQERYMVSANAGTSVRYYPSLPQEFVHGSHAGLSLAVPLGRSTSFSVSTSASYQPVNFANFYPVVTNPSPGEPIVPDLEVAITGDSYMSYQSSAGISHQISARTSLTGGASYQTADRSEGSRFEQWGGRAALTYNIGRGFDARAGYAYSVAEYSSGRDVANHAINAGVDYSRNLSFSRRTTLAFGTGSAATATEERTRFTLTGSAQLEHELGRTWNAWLAYARQVQLHENFQEPVTADSLTTGVGGLITRRLTFSASASAALGRSGGGGQDQPGFDNTTGRASLSYAMTRFVNMALTYSYYRHRIDEDLLLTFDTPRSMDRHSIRASVSLWAPLMTLTRSTSGSR